MPRVRTLVGWLIPGRLKKKLRSMVGGWGAKPISQSLLSDVTLSSADDLSSIACALYSGDQASGAYNARLWIPWLKSAGADFIVIVRHLSVYLELRKNDPALKLAVVKTNRGAESLIESLSNLRAVFYVGNSGNNLHLLRYLRLRHIFLGHGDSDKANSMNKFFRVYDEIWTAGRAHIDRFRLSSVPFSDVLFRIVGRPNVRNLMSAESGTSHVLYLPTWEGYQSSQCYSSLLLAPDILETARNVLELPLMTKFHPTTGSQLTEYATMARHLNEQKPRYPLNILPRSFPVEGAMGDAALLITDLSSVISDFLVTGRPIFVFQPEAAGIMTSNPSIDLRDYAYTFANPGELGDLLRRVMVSGDDWKLEARRRASAYLVDRDATLQGRFEQAVREVCQPNDSPASTT